MRARRPAEEEGKRGNLALGKGKERLCVLGALALLGGCAFSPPLSGLPGGGGPLPKDPPSRLVSQDPLRPLREASSPWGTLTFQGEAKVSKALGGRPFPSEPGPPRLPGDPEEQWLLHRGGHLLQPMAASLGLEKWFRKRALTFDGARIHTALQDWIARLTGDPPPRERRGPPLLALDFQGSALARGRSPFALVFRPGEEFRLQWNDRRGGLTWGHPLNGTFTAEGRISIRNARLSRPSTCLGLRARVSPGWIFRLRLGTDIGPSTLDLPWEPSRRSAPGLVLAVGIRF